MTSPAIQADSFDARNTAKGTISVVPPSRPSDVFPAGTSPAPPSNVPAVILPYVSVWPVAMALTRILRRASSSANPLVGVSIAPFVDAYSRAPATGCEPTIADGAGRFEPHDIAENDLLTINYSSGTTSRPKGVMITHRNAYMNVVGSLIHVPLTPPTVISGHSRCFTLTAGRSSGR